MVQTADLIKTIESKLGELFVGSEPKNLYDPIRYALSAGGKRIRPSLVLASCEMMGGKVKDAINAALAVEVFHNFTLLHDDIMDKADKRRGRPTVHVMWNENTAILSGDAMFAYSYELLSNYSGKTLSDLLVVFNKTVREVYEGQQYDMDFETLDSVTESEYMSMIRCKTAVLIAASLKMGAICAGASDTDSQKLYDFGLSIGFAFQIQDDWLDVYGNPEKFGKNIGGDIYSNKKTFLLVKALETAKGNDYDNLTKWLKRKRFDKEEKILAVTRIYNKLGIGDIAKTASEKLFAEAMEHLNAVSASESKKVVLKDIANTLFYREE